MLCSGNHGVLRAYGGLLANELIVDDHHVEIEGRCAAVRFELYRGDARCLDRRFVYVAQDDGVTYPLDDAAGLIKRHLLAGGRVLR